VVDERLLQGVETIAGGEALDGADGAALHPYRELTAGVHRGVVHQHCAGAALAAVAAHLRPGEPELIPQRLGEGPAVLDLQGAGLAVDGQRETPSDRRAGRLRRRGPACHRGRGDRHREAGTGFLEELPAGHVGHRNTPDWKRSRPGARPERPERPSAR
jgi:hypothetical protein